MSKKIPQSRRETIATGKSKQPEVRSTSQATKLPSATSTATAPPPGGAGPVTKFEGDANGVLELLDGIFEFADAHDDAFLGSLHFLSRDLKQLIEDGKALALAVEGKPGATEMESPRGPEPETAGKGMASDLVKPFGSLEPTGEINTARIHVRETWEQALAMKVCDGAAALGGLACCLIGNPGLTVECDACEGIPVGLIPLNHIDCLCAIGKENLTPAERRLLSQYDRGGITLGETLDIIYQAAATPGDMPLRKSLADGIKRILRAGVVFRMVGEYTASL